jgi:hypothetical protein
MRIGRVEWAIDRRGARRTFKRGLEEARQLSGFDRDWLLEQARLLAAAAPDLISVIPSAGRPHGNIVSKALCRIMLAHGHRDAAHDCVDRLS